MKIVYITNARFPTRKAYGINVVKTCEALAHAGAEVTLLAPSYRRDKLNDGISCFSADNTFTTHSIAPYIDAVVLGWFCFWINRVVFVAHILCAKEIGKTKEKIILTRDELSGWALTLLGHDVFYDLHGFPAHKKWLWARIVRGMTGIIVTSHSKIDRCTHLLGISREKIAVAPNGFDPALFDFDTEKSVLKEKLDLPKDKHIIMYTGGLYDWKGIFVLAEASALFPDLHFVFIGGMPWDVLSFTKKYSERRNIIIRGYEPHNKIPLYLRAADVLVLPNSRVSKDKIFSAHSEADTSPIKLFEYMASGTPIVASDLPSIREILNKKNAILVKPDDAVALGSGITVALQNRALSHTVSEQALLESKNYTWRKRAETILCFMVKRVSEKKEYMRIGIVLHPYDEERPAGLGRSILEITRSLLSFDEKNEYIIFLKHAPREKLRFPGNNWRIEILGGGVFWLDALPRAQKADVYIFNTPRTPFLSHQKKSIVIAHDFAYRYLQADTLRQWAINTILSWYQGRSLRRARHIIAVSEATKKDIIAFYGIRSEKISVVYQGFSHICDLSGKPVPLPEKFFLFVGVLKQRKNVENAIKAFIQFHTQNRDYHLVIVGSGEGEYARKSKYLAGQSAAAAHIHFLGFLTDNELAYVYKRATVFLFPSLIEGFGFPVLEAMDCGIPVITSKTFSLPEVGGDAALLINPLDVNEISSAMEKLIHNPGLQKNCILMGKEYVAKFSWEKAARQIHAIIASLYD